MLSITSDQAGRLNNNDDLSKEISLGTAILDLQKKAGMDYVTDLSAFPLIALTYSVSADATGGLTVVASMPFAAEVVDVIAQCTSANSSGTLTLRKATTAISSAIVCAVEGVLSRTTTIAVASYQLAKGDSLTVVSNGAGDRGKMTVILKRI